MVAAVAPRSAWMAGSATLTTDESTNAALDPSTDATRTTRRASASAPASEGPAWRASAA